ncbi:MAG: hypothetical protein KF832_21220 [Caldilineaceae bacterium]|nr:hypothetical protein [Caldilineaceae bacterium]
MQRTLQRTQHLFVIRMWQEVDTVAATQQWRGSVKHVLTDQSYYFTRLPDLLTFIAAITAGETPKANGDYQPDHASLPESLFGA